jgi:hypothetical protein
MNTSKKSPEQNLELRRERSAYRYLRLSIVLVVVILSAATSFVLLSAVVPRSQVTAVSALTVTPGVSTDPTGVLVTLDARGAWHEATNTAPGATSSGCLRTWVKAFVPVYLDRGGPLWGGRHPMPRPPTPAHVASVSYTHLRAHET